MAVAAVFVYVDGTIGQMMLPVNSPPQNWRRAKKVRFAVNMSPDIQMPSFPIEQFDLRGHMIDGRPIYCADGFDVKEAKQTILITAQEAKDERTLDELHRMVEKFVHTEYPDAIPLDQWQGDIPLTHKEITDGLEAQHILKKGARLIVAVHS